LLNHRVVEKRMLLIGDFLGADVLRRINKRFEAAEITAKYEMYQASFEIARGKLLSDQQADIDALKWDQEFAYNWLKKQAADEIETCVRRVECLKRVLEEEARLEAFVARKFKKPVEIVLPMTVTLDGGDDIPPSGKTRIGIGKISRLREANETGPLALPKLRVRPAKIPRAYVPPKNPDV
jgi:hypothetical protein